MQFANNENKNTEITNTSDDGRKKAKEYENLATILIKITSLSSGYSQDVHGMISISQNLSTKILYYKLIDGNIIVIPKGKD